MKQWASRLHAPVAEKMGIDLDAFYEQMYANNSDGDWIEFADKAIDLKWVDHIVEAIREEGIIQKPSVKCRCSASGSPSKISRIQPAVIGCISAAAKPEPFDYYFLYDPEQRYTW